MRHFFFLPLLASFLCITPDLSHIDDAKTWHVVNAKTQTTTEDNRTIVRLEPVGGSIDGKSNVGLALVENVDFSEGTVELDLKGNGEDEASFLGIAFNFVDETHFESVCFRPFNFKREGHEDHAVQYVAWPDQTWEKLRKSKPGVYEAKVNPVPDPARWFHARIEITKQKLSVWVDDAKQPCLVVDRLAPGGNGKIGLFVDSKVGAFRDLQIAPLASAKPKAK